MTNETRHKAATALMRSPVITSNEQYLPVVYIVGNHLYWFKNVARRAAYCEKKPIEMMSIEAAWIISKEKKPFDSNKVNKHFDQHGDTFGTFLFCDSEVIVNDIEVLRYEQPLNAR